MVSEILILRSAAKEEVVTSKAVKKITKIRWAIQKPSGKWKTVSRLKMFAGDSRSDIGFRVWYRRGTSPSVSLSWWSTKPHIADFTGDRDDRLVAYAKGKTNLIIRDGVSRKKAKLTLTVKNPPM